MGQCLVVQSGLGRDGVAVCTKRQGRATHRNLSLRCEMTLSQTVASISNPMEKNQARAGALRCRVVDGGGGEFGCGHGHHFRG